MSTITPVTKRKIKLRWIFLILIAVAAIWIGEDLFLPRSANIRDFDPDEIGRLEAEMWKSYYAKKEVRLFNELAETLRTQYHLPLVRSNTVAYQAAKAAFVFKDGRNREDYEKATPYLINFYSEINKVSSTKFDVDRVAQLEVEWWIIHRERANHSPEELDLALAELPAEIYHVPVENLMQHARLREQAMTIRDNKAESGGVTGEDWRQIENLLRKSYQLLHAAVNRPQTSTSLQPWP
jgi:hypothetical protein